MKPKLLDIAAALLILVSSAMLAVPSLIPTQGSDSFTVESDNGSVDYSLSVNGEYTVTSNGHTLIITVSDNSVTVTGSDCPDGLCKAMPSISRPDEVIVCLPARTVIRINGRGASLDGVAG